MGLFDDVRCKYPLPVEGDLLDRIWQTKDLICYMENYEIREDGTLWHKEYDVEDRSDPNAEGIMRVAGCMTRVNERWVRVDDFTGEVRFYGAKHPDPQSWGTGWLEFSAYFVNGRIKELHCVENRDV